MIAPVQFFTPTFKCTKVTARRRGIGLRCEPQHRSRLNGQWCKGLPFSLPEMDDLFNLPEDDAAAEVHSAHATLSSLMPIIDHTEKDQGMAFILSPCASDGGRGESG